MIISIISIILGLLSFLLNIYKGLAGLILSIPSLTLSILGLKKKEKLSILGLIISCASIILSFTITLLLVLEKI